MECLKFLSEYSFALAVLNLQKKSTVSHVTDLITSSPDRPIKPSVLLKCSASDAPALGSPEDDSTAPEGKG